MQTPNYKFLKNQGTSIYVFPGASEDNSASHQNTNYKMYFSKYTLLHLPTQNLYNPGGTSSEAIYWDFSTFSTLSTSSPAGFGDQVIESLRNYVANYEVTIRESKLNNTEYYYDPTALETATEKIFFKWCKKLNLIGYDPALPLDEYFDNLTEFESKNTNDETYFKEFLWKERETSSYDIISFEGNITYDSRQVLQLKMNGITNFRINDIIEISDIDDSSLSQEIFSDNSWLGPIKVKIVDVSVSSNNHLITLDLDSTVNLTNQLLASAKLVYHKLVQYIGEVNGVSNVQQSNKSYTEIYINVPDHAGQTPDILFRTLADSNYKPGMEYPIIPGQYQPEIIGSEVFSSPIVSNPQNYPGSYYGQFDTSDFIYEVENGDSLRRSGSYYGVSGDINDPVVDGSTIDGINIDFNIEHYVKMNLQDRSLTNFDQFNALEVDNNPPSDFEFNAILWYYTVEDSKGNKRTNLYGISLLDHPDNNPKTDEIGIKFPVLKKLVANNDQDGTAYQFSLNLNLNITNENPIDSYNPESVNSLFSMSLFNETMKRLASTNDSFLNIISEHSALKDQLDSMKQLLYSQTDFATINSKISNLEKLLQLYSTIQTISSDSIEVELVPETSPPLLRYNNVDRSYVSIESYNTSDMYNSNAVIPVEVTIPKNKNFMVQIINNDEVSLSLPNNDNLKLLLTSDLEYKQSVDILLTGSDLSSENKKLDIYISTVNPLGLSSESEISVDAPNGDPIINSSVSSNDITPIETLLIGDIDLPVFYNKSTSNPNSSKNWSKFNFNIDFSQDITLLSNNLLEVSLDANPYIVTNSIKEGDVLTLNNLFIGTSSVFNFSGQYKIEYVGTTSSQIRLDISNNADFVAYGEGNLPLSIHSSSESLLSNNPYFSLNKGQLIKLTRISQLNQISINEKYLIDIRNIDY